MEGLLFYFREKEGRRGLITTKNSQYIFMEPFEKVVYRYYFKKNGIDSEDTKITRQIADPKYLSVKVRPTSDTYLSKISDFDDIEMDPSASFKIDFEGKEEIFIDVLFESLTHRRLKVRVGTREEDKESFEDENSYSDAPDAYVKMTDVQIRYDAVHFNYIYRRSGRLKKYPTSITYEQLAHIYMDREFNSLTHIDRDYPRLEINNGLREKGWAVNILEKVIYREEAGRRIEISDEELADIIKEYATPVEILGLLKTNDVKVSNHSIRRIAELYLQDCDRVCSLPDATVHNTIDNRG